jgi:hypothetical protein
MAADEGKDFWLYIGLVISGALNIGGMASIADGVVAWAPFLHGLIDAYRWAIRDPLAYTGNAIWPFGIIPGWVFDVFVLWVSLFITLNLFWLHAHGQPVFKEVRDIYRNEGFGAASLVAVNLILFPVMLLAAYMGGRAGAGTRGVLRNFAFIFGLFIVLLLVNWPLRKFA